MDCPARFAAMATIQPPELRLKPLKTLLELKAGDSTIDVYVTVVPTKSANSVLRLVSCHYTIQLV
jgi:hypothetical protein